MEQSSQPFGFRLSDGLGPNAPLLERWVRGPEGTPYLLQRRDDGYWHIVTPWRSVEHIEYQTGPRTARLVAPVNFAGERLKDQHS
jgi:hypothetical protein